jgi:RNA polymerase sigma-70 factor (ECF subfamily)
MSRSAIAIDAERGSGPDLPPRSHNASPSMPRRSPHRSQSQEPPAQGAGQPDEVRKLDVQRLPRHRERLFRAAYAFCRSREDAEDLVQETFERVLRRPRFLRRDEDLGYLLRVLRNTWINSYKARSRRPQTVELTEAVEFVLEPGADPSVTVPELDTIYAAVGELSLPFRETIVAVDIVGLSYRQAADALGVREGTIMSRLYRARNEVAERLEKAGFGPSQPTS